MLKVGKLAAYKNVRTPIQRFKVHQGYKPTVVRKCINMHYGT